MKKKICFFSIFCLLWISISYGLTAEQRKYLLDLGILESHINEIIDKRQVSRYDATRVLNYALCYDCMFPPQYIKDRYNFGWFSNFRRQPNFYLNDIDPQNPYYYCVVSLASKDYIHGYPDSNSICGGNFCGDNNLLLGELYQMVLNVISSEIWDHYRINDPENFYNNILSIQGTPKQTQVNLLDSEIQLAERISEYGNVPYTISSFEEFFLYQKYCNLFPKDCGFQKFSNIPETTISLVNILYKENLISLEDIASFNYFQIVDGETLIQWLYKVKKIKPCKIDRDYDKDGILNEEDNCPDTYNPNQKDTDEDGIGDVCDPDIDNDGIKNPIGVVDYKGNIVIEKVLKWEKKGKKIDNCLFIPNSNQEDINQNNIGDACEKLNLSLGLEISCTPLRGDAPLTTNCEAFPEGNYKKIYWFYEGKLIGEGKNISYTFSKEGFKKIQAVLIGDSGQAKANTFLHVSGRNLDSGLQISANPMSGRVGVNVTFIPEIKGDVDYIAWDFGDGTRVNKGPNENPTHIYKNQGYYEVIAKSFKNGQVVSEASLMIKVYDDNNDGSLGGRLKADPLKGYIGEEIKFKIIPEGFTAEDVREVEWAYGDGEVERNQSLESTHIYTQEGSYLVKAVVTLKDGEKVEVSLTELIKGRSKKTGVGGQLKADPLKSFIGEEVKFKIIPEGFTAEDVDEVKWIYGDGEIKISQSLETSHVYAQEGSYLVKATVKLKDGQVVIVSLTQLVIGEDVCLNLEMARKKLKCDMDKDGIPDMCDSDIDGDGINNLLGLIKYETSDCKYTDDNIDHSILQQEYNFSLQFNFDDNLNNDIDNCPFRQNSEQIDANGNGIGDICEKSFKIITDIDNDGIPDSEDTCPTVPENHNGVQDLDGCPEIKTAETSAILRIVNCNTCPCQFADYTNPFSLGLEVYAGLINPFNGNIYIFSKPKKIGSSR